MPNRVAVSSADFIRSIGYWQGEALRQPIAITHHGRERLILAAPDQFNAAAASDASVELATLKTMCAAVLEHVEEGFLRFDAHLRMQTANAVVEAFVGLTREALLGRTVFETLPDPIASVLADRLQRVLRARKAEAFECGAFDGRHVAVRVFPLPGGVGVFLSNVTEQHALRREREESLALEGAARTHQSVAVVKLDARGRIESADAAFCAWTGFSPADLNGHRFADLIAGGGRRDLAAALERVLREGASLRLDISLLTKKSDEIAGHLAVAPILTDFVARGAQAMLTLAHAAREAAAA